MSQITINKEAVLNQYPQLREMPLDHAEIIMLSAIGMTPTTVAERVEVSRQTVYDVLKKYDVYAIIKQGMDLQKLFIASQLGSIMVEAITALNSDENLKRVKSMPPLQMMEFVNKAAQIVEKLNPRPIEVVKSESSIIKELKG